MKIYLAGGLSCDWQDRVPGNHEWLDPRTWQDDDPAVYTARDLRAIRECDVLLGYMSSANPSGFGLSLEIGFAHALGKRILFVDEIGNDWRSRYFGMHRSICEVYPSLDAAIQGLTIVCACGCRVSPDEIPCDNTECVLAQGMSAGTAEIPQEAQGEARQPGPPTADAPNPSHQESTPNDHK